VKNFYTLLDDRLKKEFLNGLLSLSKPQLSLRASLISSFILGFERFEDLGFFSI